MPNIAKPHAVQPIRLKLGGSRRLNLLLLGITLMAQLSLASLAFSNITQWWSPAWWGQLLACSVASGLVAWLSWQALRRHAWRQSPDALVMLELDREGGFSLSLRDGTRWAAQLQDNSVVFASFSLLNFRLVHGWASCVICADAVDAAEFRRLRVWLLWGRG